MPTIEPAPGDPHRERAIAESFGVDAERYDRARPRYPDALIERVVASVPTGGVLDVLDVGCGTGIAARQFQAVGCRVLGVEPDPRMAEVARRAGLPVEIATFESWEADGRAFDAVVAGTAWHWVDPVAGAAQAGRVLRPGGRLALFHNVFQLPAALAEAIAPVCLRAMPEAPIDFRAMLTRPALDSYESLFTRTVDGIRTSSVFTEPERWSYAWEHTYTRDAWLDQMPTQGVFTRLPQEKLSQVLEAAGAAIDTLGGAFTMPYTTVGVAAARMDRGASPVGRRPAASPGP
jgi:SAM-dependent methyltransferase